MPTEEKTRFEALRAFSDFYEKYYVEPHRNPQDYLDHRFIVFGSFIEWLDFKKTIYEKTSHDQPMDFVSKFQNTTKSQFRSQLMQLIRDIIYHESSSSLDFAVDLLNFLEKRLK